MDWREKLWLKKIGDLHFLVNLYVKERLVLDHSMDFLLLKPGSGHHVSWKHGCMPLVGAKDVEIIKVIPDSRITDLVSGVVWGLVQLWRFPCESLVSKTRKGLFYLTAASNRDWAEQTQIITSLLHVCIFQSAFAKGWGYTIQQGPLNPSSCSSKVKVTNGHHPSSRRLEEMRLQKCTFMTCGSSVGCWQGWGVLIRGVGRKKKKPLWGINFLSPLWSAGMFI